jgi:hypothetical protein
LAVLVAADVVVVVVVLVVAGFIGRVPLLFSSDGGIVRSVVRQTWVDDDDDDDDDETDDVGFWRETMILIMMKVVPSCTYLSRTNVRNNGTMPGVGGRFNLWKTRWAKKSQLTHESVK